MSKVGSKYLLCVSLIFGVTLFVAIIGTWFVKMPNLAFASWLVSSVCLLHFVLSVHQVNQDEMGLVLFLGKPIENVESGFQPAPWPCSILTLSKTAIQRQYPGEPSEVFQGYDIDPLPEGMVRPIRITHTSSTPGTSSAGEKNPLNRQMTTSIYLVVSFWIKNPMKFVQVIGTIDNALQHIEDVMTRTAQEIMSKKTVADCLATLGDISAAIKTETEILVKPWGVDLRDAYLERIITSKEVSEEMRSVAVSELKKQSTIITADADKYSKERAAEAEAFGIKKKGAATAGARLALLVSEAGGMKKIAEDMNIKEPELILALSTIRTALETSNHTIISGTNGMADLAGLATALKQALVTNTNP